MLLRKHHDPYALQEFDKAGKHGPQISQRKKKDLIPLLEELVLHV